MTIKKILFVEDEENLLNSFSFILENEGFEVFKASNGEAALEMLKEITPDFVILDVNLPGIDGYTVAKKIREDRNGRTILIMMLTGRHGEDEIVNALETVADDYICKPVKPRMLLARIKSILRRSEAAVSSNSGDTVSTGDISLDLSARTVKTGEKQIKLTRSEFDILSLLMKSPEHVFSRDFIISSIRGDDFFITERSIDFLISGLRRKLGTYGNLIKTVRGIGFKLESDFRND
ncbi:MAG TPA: response regulator transcription factor [bacterium]|nr:response regulator transcription factor [bacterium]HPS28868.1 response regulator transcription factor [bacterium]